MSPNRRPWTEEQLQARMQELVDLGRELRGASMAEVLALAAGGNLSGSVDEALGQGIAPLHARADWQFWGRPKQLVFADPELPAWYPGERAPWRVALYMGGRFTGKTHTGANTTWNRIERHGARSICFIGANWKDVRRTMVGGKPDTESGFLDIVPPYVRQEAEWNKNNHEIYLPTHGATIYLNTAEDEEQRGGNFDWIWGDEPIKWRRLEAVLANLLHALRKRGLRGVRTQMLLTSTPKRHLWLMQMMMDRRTLIVHGTSEENVANVDPDALADLRDRYRGRIAQQELDALLLGDNEEALTSQSVIDDLRWPNVDVPPDLDEVVIGIDPAVSKLRRNDPTGIVAAGRGKDRHLYALEEDSGRYAPDEWADHAAALAKKWGAEKIVVERHKLGDAGVALLQHALHRAGLSGKVKIVEAYSINDKWTRALPVAALYDPTRVPRARHVGYLPDLETNLTQWDPTSGVSPNTLDAYVHAAVEVMGLANIEEPEEEQAIGLAELNKQFEREEWALG